MEKLATSRAAISPPKNGWVTVYDEESDSQNDSIIHRIALGLSRSLKTDVLAFLVHDSDIARYWLYRSGSLLDEYNSEPGHFGEEVDDETRLCLRGKPELLLPLCIAGTNLQQIEAVLWGEEPPILAEHYLAQLAPLLGIDEARISLSFEYFVEDGEDILDDFSEFEMVGQ
jgi:hypothetical protein